MKKKADIIIDNGLILTVDSQDSILENHALIVSDDRIEAIIPSREAHKKYDAAQLLNAENKIVMPGLINTHTHSAMTVFRGFADDLPLYEWLNEYVFPAEGKFTSPEMVYKGTRLALAEMLLSGTTCFNDMYYHQDTAAQAAEEFGMRAVLTESMADFAVPGSKNFRQALDFTEKMYKKFRDNPLISIGAAVHAPYTANPDLLVAAKELSDKYRLLMNIHVSETARESKTIKERYGETSVHLLDDLGFLNGRTVAAHSVHVSEEEIQIYKNRGVGVAHNPECNMKIASGAAPVPRFLQEGIKVGLGTDGTASNNNLDLFEEMRSMAFLHKLTTGDPTVLSARTCVRIATMGGAKVIGKADKTGSLEIGKKADIITLDINSPHAVPLYDPYSTVVYSLNGSSVCDTLINGRILMQDRKIPGIDLNKIMHEAKNCAAYIKKNL